MSDETGGNVADKPREWWIINHPGTLETLVFDEKQRAESFSEGFNPVAHVIEYSSYERVLAERDSLREAAEALVLALRRYEHLPLPINHTVEGLTEFKNFARAALAAYRSFCSSAREGK